MEPPANRGWPPSFRAAGFSDVGRCRQTNQDQFFVDDDLGVYAIADGMGGHAAGEVASALAISSLAESMHQQRGTAPWTPEEAVHRLRVAVSEGNRRICESVISRSEWRGMGTTMVALVLAGDQAIVAHVGDSRAYLLRDGHMRQLTSDHSWVNEQVKLGLITRDDAHRHPMRNIVTRALGNQSQVEVDIRVEHVADQDVFALCSDGLNGMVADEEIEKILLAQGRIPQQACRALVERANANGGEDNITVVVVSAGRP